MRPRPAHPRAAGFTLLELILVMLIMAILAALLVPSLSGFAAGRRTSHAATLVLSLANYARTQAMAEGTTYRLNFDAGRGTVWLTEQKEGAFVPPTNPGYDEHFPLPDGVRMTVDVAPGSVVVPIIDPNVQTTTAQPTPVFGQAVGTPNSLLQVVHADAGTYVEVQPGGRIDPCRVHLSDGTGQAVDVGAASATDVMHALKPGEL